MSDLLDFYYQPDSFYNSYFFLKPVSFLFIFMYSLQLTLLVSSIIFVLKGNISTNASNSVVKALSANKSLVQLNFINLASLIGFPPLSGFLLKFIIINNLLMVGTYIEFTILFVLIIVSMAVYLQIIKLFKNTILLDENDIKPLKSNLNNKYNFYLTQVIGTFFIVFLIFFFKDFLILFSLFSV